MFLVSPRPREAACTEDKHMVRLRSIMRTCGLYDQSGEFAFQVGMPAKSGVGRILAVHPGKFAVCAWSPSLDKFGNSVAATGALSELVKHFPFE